MNEFVVEISNKTMKIIYFISCYLVTSIEY